ncbi:UDP-glucose 4-epimerase GalE [Trichlorobacter ammonificans]|uniref:UDP-glucose 4-epimerase n=1 Tax=Trichlorobacter ammonificans TaxID=2916410 RepID=A0ABN8HEF8_9BACT|nr:UDP-glucose 4-epimerase GalE [Trichlorobacter ammonificans]CAH2029926.1 UDP-glucose 4-epimerase [Trichlorobacter ammonificans]
MKILVVGGAGYIGSHMVRELLDNGYDPVILDNLSSGHRWAVPGERLVHGDLGDRALLAHLFSTYQVSAVLHFASFIQVGESVGAPLKYYHNNVANTLNLLSAMQEAGVTRFVFSSTAAVYGTPSEIPLTESAELRPENPYGRSKLMVEQILADCAHAWGLRSACLRYFNAAGAHPTAGIGEAHHPESHLIPIVLQTALGMRDSVSINGDDYPTPDGTCIRDYIHVCDLAAAHTLALRYLLDGGDSLTCNLGNGKGYSIREVIDVCRAVTGHPIPVTIAPRRAGDPAYLVASAQTAVRLLGWKPQYPDLASIVETAWAWHRPKENSLFRSI